MNFVSVNGIIPLDLGDIHYKLKDLRDPQIEFISRKIAEKVLNNLGRVAAFRVMEQVSLIEGDSCTELKVKRLGLSRIAASSAVENERNRFLTIEEAKNFRLHALGPIYRIIDSLRYPRHGNLEFKFGLKISDYHPSNFLREISEKIGVVFTMLDVPQHYSIYVELDMELTQEKSELIFAITEESDETEFSRETFTVPDERDEDGYIPEW